MKNYRRSCSIALVGAATIAGCGGTLSKATQVAATKSVATTTTASTTTTTPVPTTTQPAPTTTTTIPANVGLWGLIPDSPTAAPGAPIAWTGTEVLVAQSGCCDDPGSVNLTAYNPATHTWRTLSPTPLTPRFGSVGVWTGREMIVAGGFTSTDGSADHMFPSTAGAAWDPVTNSWHAIAPMPTALPGNNPTAVWTGHEVLVWSSGPSDSYLGTRGGEVVLAYNPATNTWRTLPSSGLEPRVDAVAVWTGTDLVVWGGLNGDGYAPSSTPISAYADGARLNLATGTWRRLPPAPVPARGEATAVWSGHEVLFWGGSTDGAGADVGQGAAYNPATDQWRALPASPLRARDRAASVWTGRAFVVIGGGVNYTLPVPGPGAAAYDPVTNTWTAMPTAPLFPYFGETDFGVPNRTADQRYDGLAVWTGRSIVLVGGYDLGQQGARSDGIEWTPAG